MSTTGRPPGGSPTIPGGGSRLRYHQRHADGNDIWLGPTRTTGVQQEERRRMTPEEYKAWVLADPVRRCAD